MLFPVDVARQLQMRRRLLCVSALSREVALLAVAISRFRADEWLNEGRIALSDRRQRVIKISHRSTSVDRCVDVT